jgi:hypothetical protein
MKATAASALGSQPARRLEHDTHKHWADGGPTTLDNLILLCRRHHRLVHEEGWTLELAQDRELVAIPP